MGLLLDVIMPVFLVIGAGYAMAKWGGMSHGAVDALMSFSQGIAVPCLLFRQISILDLKTSFEPGLLISFYAGAFLCFAAGFFGAWKLFGRPLEEAVTTGFACMFSNSLLLGLSITERAYGSAALTGNYAIIAMHSPMFYAFGITLMELVRSHGQGLSARPVALKVLRAVFTQSLVLAITLGFVVNLAHLPIPGAVDAATDMLGKAGLPTALFGLGGVLFRYRPEGDKGLIALIVGVSLLVHPVATYGLGLLLQLDVAGLRSATVTAAMPPGANAYLFAHLYAVGRRANASAVLIATALSVVTAWVWLQVLP
ncbi:AEC family transporter [bacterium]|nr:AEC family transporter [bacterium]